jgi:hypothetical protein
MFMFKFTHTYTYTVQGVAQPETDSKRAIAETKALVHIREEILQATVQAKGWPISEDDGSLFSTSIFQRLPYFTHHFSKAWTVRYDRKRVQLDGQLDATCFPR